MPVPGTDRIDDRPGIDSLMDVKRNRRHFEGRVLYLASPNELRVEMRIVSILVCLSLQWFCAWRHQAAGGLLSRVLSECSYRSIGFFFDGDAAFGFVILFCSWFLRRAPIPPSSPPVAPAGLNPGSRSFPVNLRFQDNPPSPQVNVNPTANHDVPQRHLSVRSTSRSERNGLGGGVPFGL